MINNEIEQKLISFTDKECDLEKINTEIKKGWSIVNLVKNNNCYIGIIELDKNRKKGSVYIPPRKKVKILTI